MFTLSFRNIDDFDLKIRALAVTRIHWQGSFTMMGPLGNRQRSVLLLMQIRGALLKE
jgi:hypothetical protein